MEAQVQTPTQKKLEPKKDNGKTQKIMDWVIPLGLILFTSIFTFLVTSAFDFSINPNAGSFWSTLLFSEMDSAATDVGNLAEVLIGVLGLTLTVVAIVVQLAAQRYTPKLVDLFLADRVNIFIFLGMVFAAVFCIWIIYSTSAHYTPVFGNLVLMVITTILLTLLIPYFRYVFNFLTPSNIIETIKKNTARVVKEATKRNRRSPTVKIQGQIANGMEQITDISLSAVTQMDRNVALMSIDTLCEIIRSYIGEKKNLDKNWFCPNPSHFIAISAEFMQDIEDRRIWVESRGFMDLELIFGLALKTMPDALSAIAANTRTLAITALRHDDDEAAYLCIEYFNTFLRRAINDKNQRAVFSLFYQYRRLAETILPIRLELAEEIAGFLNYYGQQSMRVGMPFLMIASAMDICTTLQTGYELEISPLDKILDTFLRIGEIPELKEIKFAHLGVRKAHVILAASLMKQGGLNKELKQIQNSLKLEKPEILEEVKVALLNVTKRKFWEITDRGGLNFEFIEPDMKEELKKFYKKYLNNSKKKSKRAGAG